MDRAARSSARGALVATAVLLLTAGCGGAERDQQLAQTRVGQAENGRLLIRRVGCAACHHIPGVEAPKGSVGPSLRGFANRSLIAGRLPNRPPQLVQWVRNAPAFDPLTAMPPMPLTEEEARDVAAYLYTLDER